MWSHLLLPLSATCHSFCVWTRQMIQTLNIKCDKRTAELKRGNGLFVMKLLLNSFSSTAHVVFFTHIYSLCYTFTRQSCPAQPVFVSSLLFVMMVTLKPHCSSCSVTECLAQGQLSHRWRKCDSFPVCGEFRDCLRKFSTYFSEQISQFSSNQSDWNRKPAAGR